MRRLQVALLLLVLGAAASAAAFSRTRDPGTKMCNFWPDFGMTWYLNQACGDDLSFSDCEIAVRAAFDSWNAVACSRFLFEYAGTTSRTDIGFDQEHWNDNINLVYFIESDWPHEHSAIALTTTTYDVNTGELVDGDVEMNGTDYVFSVTEPPPSGRTDIQNTLTHEAGHMLGLDHSSNSQATMYATAQPGETSKRTLHQDDIDGICFVYPLSGGIPIYTDSSLSEVCGVGEDLGCRCSAGESGSAGWLMLMAGLAELFRQRRRRCVH